MIVTTRTVFQVPGFRLRCGAVIDARAGYETYGTLNEAKDNAILVSHYFSAFGHAAGKYREEDLAAGYWDGLIGPGKPVDTDKYFVISPDNLCCIQVKNPHVTTTGPATVNPDTGKPYGMEFPVVDTADIADFQKLLVESLGITRLKAAMGPSLGGMVTMQLSLRHPEFVERYIGVVTSYQNPVSPSFQYAIRLSAQMDHNWNGGDYYGKEEPKDALMLVAQLLLISAYTEKSLERMFPRDSSDDRTYRDMVSTASYEDAMEKIAAMTVVYADFNSWIYASRITMNHDVVHGFESLAASLSRMQARTLMIPNRQDLLEDASFSARMVEVLKSLGKDARLYEIDSDLGHMAGIFQTGLFAEEVKKFLEN